MRRFVALLIISFSLAALPACDLQQNIADRGDIGGANPTQAPDVSGAELSRQAGSRSFSLSANRGKVVVVDFWGSWCGPCREEQPDLNAIAATYQARGVIFIGVAMRDDTASVQAYLAGNAVPYPTVMDTDESISGAYNVASPPTTVVIDARGKVASRYLGTTAGMTTELDTLLKNGSA